MDDQFDQLSRAVAGHLPRRHALKLALKLIGATAAGMGAALLGLRPASAQPDICVDPTCNNEGDRCCDGKGTCVLDRVGEGFVCVPKS